MVQFLVTFTVNENPIAEFEFMQYLLLLCIKFVLFILFCSQILFYKNTSLLLIAHAEQLNCIYFI